MQPACLGIRDDARHPRPHHLARRSFNTSLREQPLAPRSLLDRGPGAWLSATCCAIDQDDEIADAFPYPAHPRTPYEPLVVNAALTGMVAQRERVPNVPLTPAEIAADAQRCYDAGATVVHLHARDDHARPDWRHEAYAELVPEIRGRCPGIVVCITTSGRATPEVARRADVLALEGDARPDMASLTLGSLNFRGGPSINAIDTVETLAARMMEREIAPELEIFDLGMAHLARRLLVHGQVAAPLYANLMLGFPNSAPADARSLVALIEALPMGTIWAAAGLGAFQAPANALAIAMGGHVRTGLEDNPWFDASGERPATNAGLVERAVTMAAAVGRPIAAPDETRSMLGLPVPVLAPSPGAIDLRA
jgi:3-keto-5-aminohexanoate cleavage enzyme